MNKGMRSIREIVILFGKFKDVPFLHNENNVSFSMISIIDDLERYCNRSKQSLLRHAKRKSELTNSSDFILLL